MTNFCSSPFCRGRYLFYQLIEDEEEEEESHIYISALKFSLPLIEVKR